MANAVWDGSSLDFFTLSARRIFSKIVARSHLGTIFANFFQVYSYFLSFNLRCALLLLVLHSLGSYHNPLSPHYVIHHSLPLILLFAQ